MRHRTFTSDMETEVIVLSPAVEFNFDSTSTSPYATAPSSPKMCFGNSFSRPSSFFHDLSAVNPDDAAVGEQSTIPFASFEEDPEQNGEDADFAFDSSGQLERHSLSAADELFDGGKIRPLKPPPPRLQSTDDHRRSPTLSPRRKKKYTDPLSAPLNQTPGDQTENASKRGRERTTTTTTTITRHKASRSLSPLRVSDIVPDEENNTKISTNQAFTWYNKWNLKNLLLFRSTSEGSATTRKDPPKKYAMITKGDQDVKNSSFRSTDSAPMAEPRRRLRRKVSAHEIHYMANRAVAEEMRRKTFLPYRSGLLGCLGIK